MIESWRPVVGFEGAYEVSDQGRVRSIDRFVSQCGYTRRLRGYTLRPALTGPYPHVVLRDSGRVRTARLHRLVAEAFLPPPNPGQTCVCHQDGNPLNNHLDNLRWDTVSANEIDAVNHGTHKQASKTHCKRGHAFTPENTIHVKQFRNGRLSHQRQCRQCDRLRAKGRI